MELILASTSPYRRQLLTRLDLPFECRSPNVDERPLAGESARALASRLALAKARSIASEEAEAVVIGSDQVAVLDDTLLGKPGNEEAARAQLTLCSGRALRFYTGLAVACPALDFEQVHVEPFTVHFRVLDEMTIANYLRREKPYDCAGSFKCEGLGIALFTRLEGDDPTSLEGLPLIALTTLLSAAGIEVIS